MTQPCHKDTTLNQQCCDSKHKGRKEANNTRGSRTTQDAGPNPNMGITAHTTPAIQQDHHANRRGTPTHRRGHRHSTGRPATLPPFNRHATHPPHTRPTIHDSPTLHHDEGGGADRGYPTTRTAQTHTHHPHTTHPAGNSARRDSSTRQHCDRVSRALATPLHWAGQQQHTPPPFHTPRRMDTIHSPTHSTLTLFVFTQPTINDDH